MMSEDVKLYYERNRREQILAEIKYYKYKIKLLNNELREISEDICCRSGCDFAPWENGGSFYFRKCKICGKLDTSTKKPSDFGMGEMKVRKRER